MSPSDDGPFHLWIARDEKVMAVARTAIRMSGKAHVYESGNITELTPGQDVTTIAGGKRLAILLTLVFLVSVYACGELSGSYVWLLPTALLILAFMVLFFLRGLVKITTGTVVTPEAGGSPDIHRILTTDEDQRSFRDLQNLAERIGKALPASAGLIDPNDVAELMARSLWEGAGTLARRQEIRGVRDDLGQYEPTGSPETSGAHLDLPGRQRHADALWNEVNEDLERLTSHLAVLAESGEADENTAVVTAYRDLNNLYGGKS